MEEWAWSSCRRDVDDEELQSEHDHRQGRGAGLTGDEKEAGDFSSWLAGMQAAIRGERGSDVPCDGCTACCTSSQFIHVGPDETDTLARIPA
jgi:hypothetical protein